MFGLDLQFPVSYGLGFSGWRVGGAQALKAGLHA